MYNLSQVKFTILLFALVLFFTACKKEGDVINIYNQLGNEEETQIKDTVAAVVTIPLTDSTATSTVTSTDTTSAVTPTDTLITTEVTETEVDPNEVIEIQPIPNFDLITSMVTSFRTRGGFSIKTTKFFYDDKKRLIRKDSPNDILKYDYSTEGVVIVKQLALSGSLSNTYTHTLGANGYVATTHKLQATRNAQNILISEYEYNQNGQIISLQSYETINGRISALYEYSYDGTGNLYETIINYSSSTANRIVYEYDLGVSNGLTGINMGLYFYGMQSTNIITSSDRYGEVNGNSHKRYEYRYDEQSRPIRSIVDHWRGNDPRENYEVDYTYMK